MEGQYLCLLDVASWVWGSAALQGLYLHMNGHTDLALHSQNANSQRRKQILLRTLFRKK